ncbi:MAG: cofactor-independent phosphoglycerate mutase [Candidatus Tectomicrobia bacterium]|uniref:Cofactor-independent phosphoglycerate mutase n=1 Tax=Tectimicrobiota bacterium TaxID=2528274 RepID=A0A933LR24_UNCTE|nr:cofactor-independent phosphoglycerate mutase [Candidatus Tectomicrobia bacterium]
MKYIVLVGDGMADLPLEELGGKTPLQAAKTPQMDAIARMGVTGSVRTVPQGIAPGSDVANLSILGYDPQKYYGGRAPLEAAGLGITLSPKDVAFRCNLVTLAIMGSSVSMEDYSAGHISSEEATVLIKSLQENLGGDDLTFYPGKSYRHLMVWHGGASAMELIPPHDITGQSIKDYLPKGPGSEFILKIMSESQIYLHNHPINEKRVERGENEANSVWLWGQGSPPKLDHFRKKFGLTGEGALISAVDLLRGIGKIIGLEVVLVPGVTGYLDTNYEGKAEAALEQLKEKDFVYVHVEAPDEASHVGDLKSKIKALEDLDSRLIKKVLEGMKDWSDYRILLLTDHPTPISTQTHSAEPVPFAIYAPNIKADQGDRFDESLLTKGSLRFKEGHLLMKYFLSNKC